MRQLIRFGGRVFNGKQIIQINQDQQHVLFCKNFRSQHFAATYIFDAKKTRAAKMMSVIKTIESNKAHFKYSSLQSKKE